MDNDNTSQKPRQKPPVRLPPPPALPGTALPSTALPLPQAPTIPDHARKLLDLHSYRGTLVSSEAVPTNSQREFSLYAYITHHISLLIVATKHLDRIPRFWSSLTHTRIKKHFFEIHPPSPQKAPTSNSTYTETI